MANYTIDPTEVREAKRIEAEAVVLGETIAVGAWVRYDTSNGQVLNANGTTSAEARAIGMLISKNGAGTAGTVLRKGLAYVGDAVDADDYDDPVYLSDTDGVSADAAGTVSTIVARIVPAWGSTTAAKLLRIDL